jgi:curved DNA-binding protein
MPPASDESARELWAKLAEKAAFNPRTQWSK